MTEQESQEKQQKFIELRAKGWSFAKIGAQIDVSKKTLISWSRKFQFDIRNERCLELENLQHELLDTHDARARTLGAQLKRVRAELATRDVTKLPTSRLYALADSLSRQIVRETGAVRFTSPTTEIPKEEFHRTVHDWTA